MPGAELATGYVAIIPSFRGAQVVIERELSQPLVRAGGTAGDQAGANFSSRFGKAAKTAGSGVGSALGFLAKGTAVVGTAAISAGVALGTMGIKGAAALETTTTSFTSLLGSSKAATQQIQLLQKYAAATPFSQQDVLGYAQQYYALAGSIGASKAQVVPFLDAVGNLGAVTGASTAGIHNAVMAIGQIGSAGKVTLENLNQISEAFPGFNGAAAIASATGKTTAQTLKAISAGSLDAKTGVAALLKGMAAYPGAAGAMTAQSLTLNGRLSTLKDTLSIGLTKAVQPLVPLINQGLAVATEKLAILMPKVAVGVAAVVRWAQQLYARFNENNQGGAKFASVTDRIKTAAAGLWPQIKSGAEQMKGLKPVITVTGALFKFLADHIGTVVKYMPLLIAAFVAYKVAQSAASAATIFHIPLLAASIVANFALASANRSLAIALGYTRVGILSNIVAHIQQGVVFLVSTVRTVAYAVAVRAVSIAQTLAAVSARVLGVAMAFALGPVGLIIIGIAALVTGLILAYKNSETFRNVVQGVMHAAQVAIGAVVDFVVKYVPPLFHIMLLPFQLWYKFLKIEIGLVIGAIRLVVTAVGAVGRAFGTAFTSTVGFIGKIFSAVAALPGQIVGLGARMVDAGKSLMGALFNGLKSAAGAAGGFAADIASAIVDKLKGILNNILPHKLHIGLPFGKSLDAPLFPMLAKGGTAYGGQPVIVGEQGPEIFVPGATGQVIPNDAASKFTGNHGPAAVYVQNPFTGEYLLGKMLDVADGAVAYGIDVGTDYASYNR